MITGWSGGGHGAWRVGAARGAVAWRLALTTLAATFVPSAAHAELVYFATGRSLSVKSHRVDGDSLVLALRGGGEIVCDRAVITRIAADEVPYPEPEAPAPPERSGLEAPAEYVPIIRKVAGEQGVDARLVDALIRVESGYQPRARSAKGAMGLMQLMPETARQYALTNPYEPAQNITAGIRHLRALLDKFPTLPLALAAYNAGEAAVQRYGGVPPFAETENYVTRILQLVGAGRR